MFLLDLKADYVSLNLTIPNTPQPVPSIFIDGWIIIQKNVLGNCAIFDRSWIDYRNGFGDEEGNYLWFGNEKLYQLLTTGSWKLRVEVQSNDTVNWYSAEYDSFQLSNEATKYVINVAGYTGDAGDAFSVVSKGQYVTNGMKFSTFDKDNDEYSGGNCAISTNGGWWNNHCGTSRLNGCAAGAWGTLQLQGLAPKYFVSSSRMMIKKIDQI